MANPDDWILTESSQIYVQNCCHRHALFVTLNYARHSFGPALPKIVMIDNGIPAEPWQGIVKQP